MKTGTFRLAALLLSLSIQACGAGGGTSSTPVPAPAAKTAQVQRTEPANLRTGVPFGTSLAVTMDEDVDSTTVNTGSFRLMADRGSPVTGTVNTSGHTALFRPTTQLQPDTVYTATMSRDIKLKNGDSLTNDYSWTFVTGTVPDVTPPQVTLTAFAIAKTNGVYGGLVVAFFSEFMDPATINTDTFQVTDPDGNPVPGTTAYIGLNAIFYPLVALQPNATYTATITTGVQDLSGNAMTEPNSWTFDTPNAATLLGTISTVKSTSPAANAVEVPLGAEISAAFSQTMDSFTLTTDTVTLQAPGGVKVPGTVSYDGINVVFMPAAPLQPNTSYMATITSDAKSLAGVPLDSDYVWMFMTGSDAGPVAPKVVFNAPADGAAGIDTDDSLVIDFSEAMDAHSLAASNITVTSSQGQDVPGSVTYNDTSAVFTPSAALRPRMTYTVKVSGAVLSTGGIAMGDDFSWSFATGNFVTGAAPVVVFSDPAPYAHSVSRSNPISIAFSAVLDPTSVNTTTVQVVDADGTPVAGSVSYLGDVVQFTPLSLLDPNTYYTVTLSTGIKGLAGDAFQADYSWSFITQQIM